MDKNEIWHAIDQEIKISKKSTTWPEHPVAQAGLVANASGMLLNASIDYKYHRGSSEDDIAAQKLRMKKEAIETAVTAFRFLENL